ncbi:MAG: radical SAM protein [Firmicutes bacterium]|nr:radical SAM protein [Bacillota bacterium]
MDGIPKRFRPGYLKLLASGELQARISKAYERLADCDLCPRLCHVDRTAGKKGYCRAGKDPVVASYGPHFGEEAPLVGWGGSGTIFFAYCTLRCVFCQNFDISYMAQGDLIPPEELAEVMLGLQEAGCHNINLVTPTHYVAPILAATGIAAKKGLSLPLVYNTSGYERVETLRLLDGAVDIYMPDMKYGDSEMAAMYSDAGDYAEINREAVKEMYRQVGNLVVDENGIALKGLIIRHLVMPENQAATGQVMKVIAEEISPDAFVNVMDQYRPTFKAKDFPRIARPITRREYRDALNAAREAGIRNIK